MQPNHRLELRVIEQATAAAQQVAHVQGPQFILGARQPSAHGGVRVNDLPAIVEQQHADQCLCG